MKIQPTLRNVVLFFVLFQVFPVSAWFLIQMLKPVSPAWRLYGVFAISELVAVLWILGWKQKGEVETHGCTRSQDLSKNRGFPMEMKVSEGR